MLKKVLWLSNLACMYIVWYTLHLDRTSLKLLLHSLRRVRSCVCALPQEWEASSRLVHRVQSLGTAAAADCPDFFWTLFFSCVGWTPVMLCSIWHYLEIGTWPLCIQHSNDTVGKKFYSSYTQKYHKHQKFMTLNSNQGEVHGSKKVTCIRN